MRFLPPSSPCLWTLPTQSLPPVRDTLLLIFSGKGQTWWLQGTLCAGVRSLCLQKDSSSQKHNCGFICGTVSAVPSWGGRGSSSTTRSLPHFRNARHCLKEPKLFSVSIFTLCNKVHCLYVGYREKNQCWSSHGRFLKSGTWNGLKGLIEFGERIWVKKRREGTTFPSRGKNPHRDTVHGVLGWSKPGLKLRTGDNID